MQSIKANDKNDIIITITRNRSTSQPCIHALMNRYYYLREMGNNSNAIRKETQETIIDRFSKGQVVADFMHCQEQRVCCKPSVAVGNLWGENDNG